MQNYFVFQPMYKYFKRVTDSTDNIVYVRYWQSKGLSDGKINAPNTSSSNDQAVTSHFVITVPYSNT